MKAGRIRLIIAVALMAGWLGYLGFLALGQANPIVVSRSQLLQASHFVKGEVTTDAAGKPVGFIVVRESFGANRIAGEAIEIDDIAKVQTPDGKPLSAGAYFFPLISGSLGRYRVVLHPGSEAQAKMTVYPWTPEVERQVRN